METKECGFSGFKMNGFLALFLHLVVLTAVIIFGFIISVPTLILSVCLCLDRKSTRLNSSHPNPSRMPSSA